VHNPFILQDVLCIVPQSIVALLHRKPVSIGASCDSHPRGIDEGDTLNLGSVIVRHQNFYMSDCVNKHNLVRVKLGFGRNCEGAENANFFICDVVL